MAFKLVISDPKTGKTYQKELEDVSALLGKKLSEKIQGDTIGLPGYELELTGGSDSVGNPMRNDVSGAASRRLLLSGGVGFNPLHKGERRKKRIRGRTISGDIVQVNMKVVTAGTPALDKLLGKAEAPKEEKPAEAPKEETAPVEEKSE
ncbi:MAG: 30S ribosomal protein S6e [archaeon]